eukprot:07339.XXX_30816_31007_1 [CDS] Oithona nana genome sequencing.
MNYKLICLPVQMFFGNRLLLTLLTSLLFFKSKTILALKFLFHSFFQSLLNLTLNFSYHINFFH